MRAGKLGQIQHRGSIRFKLVAFIAIILFASIVCFSIVITYNLRNSKIADLSSKTNELNQALTANIETLMQGKSILVSTVKELTDNKSDNSSEIRSVLKAIINNDPEAVGGKTN